MTDKIEDVVESWEKPYSYKALNIGPISFGFFITFEDDILRVGKTWSLKEAKIIVGMLNGAFNLGKRERPCNSSEAPLY